MNRRIKILSTCLALSLAFACWTWLRPYEWKSDPGARYRILHSTIIQDHSFYWLGIRLEKRFPEGHDLMKPVTLILADGREMEPAETGFEGTDSNPRSHIGFKFWLEEKDLHGPIRLKLNDGILTVRKKAGPLPALGGRPRYHTTANW